MDKLKSYLVAYIIIFTIIQNVIFYVRQKHGVNIKMDERIDFNVQNADSIEKLIKEELLAKLNLLKTPTTISDPNKLNYEDWIKRNLKDPFIRHPTDESMKYWIQIWRYIPNTANENFQLKVYPEDRYVDHTWKDMINFNNQRFISNHVETDSQLIKKFFLAGETPFSIFRFYWYDPVFDKIVERKSIVMQYDDGLGNKGTLSSGYTIKNITKDYTYNHYNDTSGKPLYVVGLIFTVVITSIIYYCNRTNEKLAFVKSLLFFTILMSYISYYFSIYDENGTFEIEKSKFENINQGILSMSFMTGISIFILTAMKKEKKDYLYNETAFLLVIVMITIIGSLVKNNSYITPAEITEIRSTKEFMFNYCIFVNLSIIINFGINVFF